MTRAVHRAGFRPLAFASRHLLLRPAALKIAASIVLTLLALGLYSLSRGSYPLPASTLARALLAPQEMGEQPRFILFDIRLPRILAAMLLGGALFLISDTFLLIRLFSPYKKGWFGTVVLATYYPAQILLALSILAV